MSTPREWLAVYTKSRTEKKVADRLLQRENIEAYCPFRRVLKQWSDRKKWVDEPLFNSYVFVHVDAHERSRVLFDPGVIQYVYWLGKPAIIRDEEIEAIRRFLDEHPSAEARKLNLAPGTPVSIKAGPMKGREGVVRRTEKNHVLVEIPSIGFELVARINKDYL
jgi:transcription antitermination factor NusG